MHNGDWNDGWGGGSWWWMAIMMIAFWGGVIWLAVTFIRRGPNTSHPHTHDTQPLAAARPAAQEILAERLARGEIEPDDYRQRLDALRHQPEK